MSANSDIVDALLSHRLDLLRFERGVVLDVLAAFDLALADVVEDLTRAADLAEQGKALSTATVRGLRRRGAALEREIGLLVRGLDGTLTEGILAGARFEALALRGVARAGGVYDAGLLWSTPSRLQVLAAIDPEGSRPWSRLVARHGGTARGALALGIARVTAGSVSPARLIRDVRAGLGVVENTRNHLSGLVRTEIQAAANRSALATYKLNRDVVGGVVYLATLDDRTCLICGPDHGSEYDLDKRGNLPDRAPVVPQHPRCRCIWSPRTRRWDELGLTKQRQAFDGLSVAGPTFEEYLRSDTAAARKILGPSKFAAWEEGLPVDRFVDNRGPLSVADLRKRYPDEFSAAA